VFLRAGADRFALGAVNGESLKTSWTSQGWYCVGWGTPWMFEPDGRIYAVTVLSPADGELKFLAVFDTARSPAACGPNSPSRGRRVVVERDLVEDGVFEIGEQMQIAAAYGQEYADNFRSAPRTSAPDLRRA
jgi:hypothetical protein